MGRAAEARIAQPEPMPSSATAGPGYARIAGALGGIAPQLSRYTIVSVLALWLDTALFLALTHGIGLGAWLAGIIGYSTGLVLHFVLSLRFVFDAATSGKSRTRLFAEFATSGLVGLAITTGVIRLVVDFAGAPPVIGKAAAVALSFVAVFVLRRSIVFADHRAT